MDMSKIAFIVSTLDRIATEIEGHNIRIAFVLDGISNRLEKWAAARCFIDQLFMQFSQARPELKGDKLSRAFWDYVKSVPSLLDKVKQEMGGRPIPAVGSPTL